jgi:hypothetical protein
MEFAGVINSFASRDPIGIIKKSTTYTAGRPTTIESKPVYVLGAVQPSIPEVRNRVPEGSKNQETLTFWISTIITDDGPLEITANDIIEYRGSRYFIFEISPWNHIGDYTELSATKEIL